MPLMIVESAGAPASQPVESCPPTTRSRRDVEDALRAAREPEPIEDATEVLQLRARVERLKLENLALMREEKEMREAKDDAGRRSGQLLEFVREGRRLFREYHEASVAWYALAAASPDQQKHPTEAFIRSTAAYRALEDWAKKNP